MSSPVWFITGASNGFGLLLALRALKAGHRVIGTARNPTKSAAAVEQIQKAGGKVITLDMTEPRESIIQKVQDAEKIYGHFDYFLNNAGYSLLGPLEHLAEKDFETQYKTNVFGLLWATQAALPKMRERKSGLIVNFSSVAGHDANPAVGAYASTKFAVEALSESLSKEVAPFGIQVLIIEPGAFRTNFLGAFQVSSEALPEHYQGTAVENTLKAMSSNNGKQKGNPEKAIEKLYELFTGEGETGNLKGKILRYAIGEDALTRIDNKTKKLAEDMALSRESETSFSSAY